VDASVAKEAAERRDDSDIKSSSNKNLNQKIHLRDSCYYSSTKNDSTCNDLNDDDDDDDDERRG